jgi:hypothetical protein
MREDTKVGPMVSKSEPQNIQCRMFNVEGKTSGNFVVRYSLFDIHHSFFHSPAIRESKAKGLRSVEDYGR